MLCSRDDNLTAHGELWLALGRFAGEAVLGKDVAESSYLVVVCIELVVVSLEITSAVDEWSCSVAARLVWYAM